MHYILHIDTATDTGLVALSEDGTLISFKVTDSQRNHAGSINLMIEALLQDCNVKMTQLSAVAVNAGPGSYTGLRIGMATAKGLCYALNIPLMADNRLIILTSQNYLLHTSKYDYYLTLLEARSKEYFMVMFNNLFETIYAPQHIMEEELKEMIDTKATYYLQTDKKNDIFYSLENPKNEVILGAEIDLKAWCHFSFNRFNCHEFETLSEAEPFYLKQVYTHN